MMIPFLNLQAMHQDLADDLKMKFAQVVDQGLFSGGREVEVLEDAMRNSLQIPHAIACANGSDALELALRALGIGPDDEVIVPALTWVSTAEAVHLTGAKAVFCDVDDRGLMDVQSLPKIIGAQTKAVIPVHLYGQMVDMSPLMNLAKAYGLFVVEDTAQAFGATQKGKPAGAWGDIGCFSFYPTKNLGALGEAGMLATENDHYAHRLRLLLNHGQVCRDEHQLIGRNSRIDTLQAAFLNVKWPYFKLWQEKRKKLAGLYMEQLQHLKGIRVPEGILKADHNRHLFTIRLEERDKLKSYLAEKGIGTAIHYPSSVPATMAFEGRGDFPMANEIARTTLSLPLHPYLGESEVRQVCEGIRSFFKQ
ncbi:DegT/DnrJ/EryC1/StrS family aminotransferase [Echinicola sediminis]